MLGLDALNYRLLNILHHSGKIPFFSQWMHRNFRANLATVVPPMSPGAWNTTYSGLLPANHGILDFLTHKEGLYNLTLDLDHYKHGALWKYLDALSQKTILFNTVFADATQTNDHTVVINPPYHPLQESDSLFQGGFQQLGIDTVYKNSLLGKYLQNPVVDHNKWDDDSAYRSQILSQTLASIPARFDMIQQIMQKAEWNLIVTTFTDFDVFQHFTWHNVDLSHPDFQAYEEAEDSPLQQIALAFDKAFEQFISTLDDDVIVVINSDHGMTRVYQSFAINKWLENNGYLVKQKTENKDYHSGYEIDDFHEMIDWGETTAYAFGLHGGIRLNVKGREPWGKISTEDASKVTSEITQKLYAYEKETREVLFKRIYSGDELFSGALKHQMPDIVIEYDEGTLNNPSLKTQELLARKRPITGYTSMHEKWGVLFVGHGPIQPTSIPHAKIEDIAPTVMRLMGLPLPQGIDGKPIRELSDYYPNEESHFPFDFKWNSPQTSEEAETANPDHSDAIKQRLAALGYIEGFSELESPSPPEPENQDSDKDRYIQTMQDSLKRQDALINQLKTDHEKIVESLNYENAKRDESVKLRDSMLQDLYKEVEKRDQAYAQLNDELYGEIAIRDDMLQKQYKELKTKEEMLKQFSKEFESASPFKIIEKVIRSFQK